jgi:hypothetical protein
LIDGLGVLVGVIVIRIKDCVRVGVIVDWIDIIIGRIISCMRITSGGVNCSVNTISARTITITYIVTTLFSSSTIIVTSSINITTTTSLITMTTILYHH